MPVCFAQLNGALYRTTLESDFLINRTNFKTVCTQHLSNETYYFSKFSDQ